MRSLLSLLAAIALVACGDADAPVEAPVVSESTTVAVEAGTADGDAADTETVDVQDTPAAQSTTSAAATPRPAAPAAPAGPTTAQCRSRVAPEVVDAAYYQVVASQTFAFTSPAYGAGCFVTTELQQDARDLDMVSAYSFLVTNADGTQTVALEFAADAQPATQHDLAAIGFADVNSDGTRDILVVNADCAEAYVWIASGNNWEHYPPYSGKPGLAACTVDEAKAEFREMFSEPLSP